MGKIRGKNLRVFSALFAGGSKAVPEETGLSVTLTGNTESTATKDVEGLYAKDDVVSTSFSVQVDTFLAEPHDLYWILGTFSQANAQLIGWDQTLDAAGTENRDHANADFKRSGHAILNDFTMKFDDRTAVATTLQFQGTGALS